jgi:hypothetical protein
MIAYTVKRIKIFLRYNEVFSISTTLMLYVSPNYSPHVHMRAHALRAHKMMFLHPVVLCSGITASLGSASITTINTHILISLRR